MSACAGKVDRLQRMRRAHVPRPKVQWQLAAGDRLPLVLSGSLSSQRLDPDAISRFTSLQFCANDRMLWSVDLYDNDIASARNRACKEMRDQAAGLGANLHCMIRDLRTALHWQEDEARALGLLFVFPGPYAIEAIGARWREPKRRGRPTSVKRALVVRRLVLAWQALTGKPAGISHAHFLDAVTEAVPFMGLSSMRGQPLADTEKFLRQERQKLRSRHFEWNRPRARDPRRELLFVTPASVLPKVDQPN